MLMRGGGGRGRSELFMPGRLNSWFPLLPLQQVAVGLVRGKARRPICNNQTRKMPSQERKPVFLNCITHGRVHLRRPKPTSTWNRERKSFVTQICFMINHSSWDRPCCLGIRENHYGATAWEACKTVPFNKTTKKETNWTKDSVPSQNTKMIPSLLISQMIDENKSKENTAAFSMQSVITQSDVYHRNQSSTNHRSVNINRAFVLLPRKLGIQISSDDNTFGTDINREEDKQCPNMEKGFASITITARRIASPCKSEMKLDASNPFLKCQESKLVMNTAPVSSVAVLDQLCGSFRPQGYGLNQNAAKRKVSESYPPLCKGHSDWISSTENKESTSKEAPLSFTSSVHFSISSQCPNSMYYIDKSLSVPVNQLQKHQQIHRSVVSFNINCSSPNLTPDGVDGLANGELITEVLKTKLPEDRKVPLKAIWNADLKENIPDKKQTLRTDSLGTEYLWKVATLSETLSVADSPQGLDQLRPRESNDGNSSGKHITLSSHIRHWTSDEGIQAFSGSNRKQCTREKHCESTSASFLEQSSKKELMVEDSISSEDKHLPKGTSESKENHIQSFLKPKIPTSDYGHHFKFLLNTAVDEDKILRKTPFPKGDYQFCASTIMLKEHKQSEKNEMVGRVTTSTAHKPDVPHEKHKAFQQPKVCSEPEKIPANPLTLREALEVHKPNFISRSQERLKKLEHMKQMRKAQQGDSLGKTQAALSRKLSSSSITSKKKQYTVPHPLSDNLFKPKERFISEKEMHMRSKRIYNNLPEVKKKQEEKQKRIILQSNRMRAEVFKKQLLDQLLQRKTE